MIMIIMKYSNNNKIFQLRINNDYNKIFQLRIKMTENISFLKLRLQIILSTLCWEMYCNESYFLIICLFISLFTCIIIIIIH